MNIGSELRETNDDYVSTSSNETYYTQYPRNSMILGSVGGRYKKNSADERLSLGCGCYCDCPDTHTFDNARTTSIGYAFIMATIVHVC